LFVKVYGDKTVNRKLMLLE